MFVDFVLLLILLFLAALTAACEIAMIAVSRLRLRKRAAEGSRRAKTILGILEVPERFFSTILVANNIMDALIAVIVTEMMIRFVHVGGTLEVALSTVTASVLIIISEVTAKTLATQYPEKISFLLARPMQVFIFLFSPLVNIFAFITETIVRLLGAQKQAKPSLVTEEEIRALIKAGEEEGVLHQDESRMLARVFDFGETVVKKVMTPRQEVVAIDIASSFDEIVVKVSESGYSRLPVYRDRLDAIVGIINSKDLLSLACNRELIVLQDIIYPATFIPETKKVADLLKEFQKGHTHLAVVSDPAGKVLGLVTLEDLLEEIVGEIEDEYDIRLTQYKKASPAKLPKDIPLGGDSRKEASG